MKGTESPSVERRATPSTDDTINNSHNNNRWLRLLHLLLLQMHHLSVSTDCRYRKRIMVTLPAWRIPRTDLARSILKLLDFTIRTVVETIFWIICNVRLLQYFPLSSSYFFSELFSVSAEPRRGSILYACCRSRNLTACHLFFF